MGNRSELSCLGLASRQQGVIGYKQARHLGLEHHHIRWQVRVGRWKRIRPGVFVVTGSPSTWLQDLKALSLWLGDGFALSHTTAAALYGFARFREGPLEATVARRVRAPPQVVLHQGEVGWRELEAVKGLRVTSPTRTLLDLAAVVSPEDLRASCDEALRRRLTTLARLEQAVERTSSWGVIALRKLVHEYAGGEAPTESELEARALDFLDAHDFPRPTKQRCIRVGGKRRRLDLTFEAQKVVVEVDGYATHSGLKEFEDDRRRNNSLLVKGFRVLHWTHRALRDEPGRLANELRALLARDVRA